MGSVPSSPSRDRPDDPWWPIENQNLSLEQSPLQLNMDEQGQSSITEINENCANSNTIVNNEVVINKTPASESENVVDDQKIKTNQSIEEFREELKIIADGVKCVEMNSEETSSSAKKQNKEQSIEEFKEELRLKREKRQCALSELRNQITNLKQQLAEQKEINKKLKKSANNEHYNTIEENPIKIESDGSTTEYSIGQDNPDNQIDDALGQNNNIGLKSELADVQLSLQLANADVLSLTSELNATRKQVVSLKEVIAVSKQMVEIREDQLNQLKGKLKEIEDSLAERDLKIMSDNLRQEYDRQLTNIRNLRALYEERARVSAAERENLIRQLDTKRTELDAEVEKTNILVERVSSLENELQTTTTTLGNTKEELSQYKAENKELHEEMTVINELFSQLLMGFNGGNDIDIDKLTDMLEDHRDLLNDITNRESCKEGAAALPKLLFDLVTQSEEIKSNDEENTTMKSTQEQTNAEEHIALRPNVTSAQEIIHNLPKVWKVLIELLNHQKAEQVSFTENGESEECYNSVQTPTGPQLVLSVSKTYIRLKDLILEKKFLQKETNKLKNLNNHLEQRLGQQEKRLGAVSIELNKTWSLVGRMQRQHRQLHTHEQVLRYQLQQKRRMLNELKDELEYCRRKWALAREKNNESQSQWNSLRLEFSNRKLQDANNSAESGYSDDPISDDENSDNELTKMENKKPLQAQLAASSSSQKILRAHSVSPTRKTNESIVKRGNSAPPYSTIIPEAYQIVAEIVPSDVELQKAATAMDDNFGYAAAFSVVSPNAVEKISIQKQQVAIDIPIVSKKVDEISTGPHPRLSREIRRKCNVNEKKKKDGEESLEEMFYRLSGQENTNIPTVDSNPSDKITGDDDLTNKTDIKLNKIMKAEMSHIEIFTADIPCPIVFNAEIPNTEMHNAKISNTEIINHQSDDDDDLRAKRTARFQRLEEQCQQLITQVRKSSLRGDELNSQIDKVQNRCAAVTDNLKSIKSQNSIDIDSNNEGACSSDYHSNTNNTDVSDDTKCLTIKEQEYTTRRAARLKRLEVECKAFLEKVNITNDRATKMSQELENLHERHGKNNPQQENETINNISSESEPNTSSDVTLTATEEAYMARRAERLRRLEEQSVLLLSRMAQSATRADDIENQLDNLHERFGNTPSSTESVDSNIDQLVITEPIDDISEENENEIASDNEEDVIKNLENH